MAARRGRVTLLLVLATFVAPFLLADLAFRFWRPEKYTNYGELLETVEFRPSGLVGPRGETYDIAPLRGKWVFLLLEAGECDQRCKHNLYLMRQVRLALGRDQDRIERLLLTAVALPAGLASAYPGMRQARYDSMQGIGGTMARPDAVGRIHLVDPYGRFVMRYPADADGSRMIKDMKRLLQYSRL